MKKYYFISEAFENMVHGEKLIFLTDEFTYEIVSSEFDLDRQYYHDENGNKIFFKYKFTKMKELKDYSTDELRAELEKRGFITPYTLDDVDNNLREINDNSGMPDEPISLTNEQKLDILLNVMSSERIAQEVNEAIKETIQIEYSDSIDY